MPILFAFVFSLLLIPILHVMKLKIQFKGKMIVILMSFLLSLGFIYGAKLYSVLAALGLVLVTIILISIVLQERLYNQEKSVSKLKNDVEENAVTLTKSKNTHTEDDKLATETTSEAAPESNTKGTETQESKQKSKKASSGPITQEAIDELINSMATEQAAATTDDVKEDNQESTEVEETVTNEVIEESVDLFEEKTPEEVPTLKHEPIEAKEEEQPEEDSVNDDDIPEDLLAIFETRERALSEVESEAEEYQDDDEVESHERSNIFDELLGETEQGEEEINSSLKEPVLEKDSKNLQPEAATVADDDYIEVLTEFDLPQEEEHETSQNPISAFDDVSMEINDQDNGK